MKPHEARELRESPMLVVMVQHTLYVIYVLALWLLFRGHQEPGGGFVAGLLVAAAVALKGMTFGLSAARDVFAFPFYVHLGLGLSLATLALVGPTLLGYPLLKSAFGAITLPVIGDVEWSTVLVFDVGVFFVVIGAAKGILLRIADASGKPQIQEGLD